MFNTSGYRGFVPCSRGKIGKGFPLITHSALNEFTDKTADYKHRATTSEGFKAVRPQLVRLNTTPIYLSDAGLVPNYTGHIPGMMHILNVKKCLKVTCEMHLFIIMVKKFNFSKNITQKACIYMLYQLVVCECHPHYRGICLHTVQD